MRILFAGTPYIGVPSLVALHENFEVVGVLTNPDRPQGRKKKLVPSPVKEKALELGLNVIQPEKLSEVTEEINALKPDLLVCIAFGKIFKKGFLDLFKFGGINLHPSLLPIYRGPSPISEAIKNGDKVTGISIQRLALKMDSGNILHQEELELDGTETTGSLTDKVAKLGAPLIVDVVTKIANGKISEFEQEHEKATFCKLIKKSDGIIDWSMKTSDLLNFIRAFNPWPLAQATFIDKSLNIIEAKLAEDIEVNELNGEPGEVLSYSKANGYLVKTSDGAIYITMLQLQSKKILDYKSFNNGVQNFVGARLGNL